MTKANTCLQIPRQRRTAGQGCCQHTPQALAGLWLWRVWEGAQLELSSASLSSFGHLLPWRRTLWSLCFPLPSCPGWIYWLCLSRESQCWSLAPLLLRTPPGKFGSDIPQVSSHAFCELSLPDSEQQMVLFTQEIRLFIFQSHRHLQCRVWSSLNNEPSGELVFLFVSFS